MAAPLYRDPWVKKAKWLTQALIISGTLNIGLLSTFIYFALSDRQGFFASHEESGPKELREQLGLQELLAKYSSLSFQDLLLRLGNNDHVESGYTRRDLALASLVAFHHFNIERALGGVVLQKREITCTHEQAPISLTIFPGLADYQYQAIMQYAKTEKWPLTSQGLFLKLQATKPPYDPSLLEAFYLTPEFHFIHLLFSKTSVHLKKEYIVALLAQSNWPTINEISDRLRIHSQFTLDERRQCLLTLTLQGSKLAAKILLETDPEYCLKYFNNEQVQFVCELLGEKTTPSFLKALLLSPRSDEIWKKAAAILYEQAAEDVPQTLQLEEVKQRFIELKAPEAPMVTPAVAPVIKSTPPTQRQQKNSMYTVVSGDSLWKIASSKHTTVKALREANHLTSDKLKIGQVLIIP